MNIKQLSLYILLICLSNVGCKSNHTENKNKELPKALQGEWYRRYTGFLGDKAVVVNLHHYGDITVGSYYYVQKNEIIDLTESEDTIDNWGFHFTELERTNRLADDDTYKPGRWAINFNDSEINGKWTSGDNSKVYAIDLKEDYPEGSYALNLISHADSSGERKGITNTIAVSSYEILEPGVKMKKEDAAFFRTAILHLLGGDTFGAKNIAEYVKKEDKKYFQTYKKLLADLIIDRNTHEEWQYNFYHSRNIWTLYNDSGMISVALHEYDYSGGGNGIGNYWNSYSCIDIQQKRIWLLNDMMNNNPEKLQPILDHEIRKIFNLNPKDLLTSKLKADAVPLTENVYVTGNGITFCYHPGEIADESYDEICLFIPYASLRELLKDDFRKRMHL